MLMGPVAATPQQTAAALDQHLAELLDLLIVEFVAATEAWERAHPQEVEA
jgi:hypothetical protein